MSRAQSKKALERARELATGGEDSVVLEIRTCVFDPDDLDSYRRMRAEANLPPLSDDEIRALRDARSTITRGGRAVADPQDVATERRLADGRNSPLATAGPDPAARNRAAALARKAEVAEEKLKERAARVLERLGPTAFDAAARSRASEALWAGHTDAATFQRFEANARGYAALRAGHLYDREARALIEQVEGEAEDADEDVSPPVTA